MSLKSFNEINGAGSLEDSLKDGIQINPVTSQRSLYPVSIKDDFSKDNLNNERIVKLKDVKSFFLDLDVNLDKSLSKEEFLYGLRILCDGHQLSDTQLMDRIPIQTRNKLNGCGDNITFEIFKVIIMRNSIKINDVENIELWGTKVEIMSKNQVTFSSLCLYVV